MGYIYMNKIYKIEAREHGNFRAMQRFTLQGGFRINSANYIKNINKLKKSIFRFYPIYMKVWSDYTISPLTGIQTDIHT